MKEYTIKNVVIFGLLCLLITVCIFAMVALCLYIKYQGDLAIIQKFIDSGCQISPELLSQFGIK